MTLKELRTSAGMTQAQLSKSSGINVMRISKIERGEIKIENISIRTASALASALGIKIEDFLPNA